ncbi:hypothetical protein AB832_06255 [Flavobacteriaceae bacterium (ex Bugula neritina AB1)]|nr:hypothetical protein AB832_06255 [Flavobacteriaceae bacterium (ex Bugula neritina AB1)]
MRYSVFVSLFFSLVIISCGQQGNDKPKASDSESNTIKIQQHIQKEETSTTDKNAVTIRLGSTDEMLFDKTEIKVKQGQQVTLILIHQGKLPKNIMGHNFVLLKKGVDPIDFGQRAASARDTEYIPEGNEFIVHTKLIGGGEQTTIRFAAPEKGVYDYICSFPVHYALMKGKFIVE